jgi:hypothetical protein
MSATRTSRAFATVGKSLRDPKVPSPLPRQTEKSFKPRLDATTSSLPSIPTEGEEERVTVLSSTGRASVVSDDLRRDDRLRLEERLETRDTELPADPGLLESPERGRELDLDGVDHHAPGLELGGDDAGALRVRGEDVRLEAVERTAGDASTIGFRAVSCPVLFPPTSIAPTRGPSDRGSWTARLVYS